MNVLFLDNSLAVCVKPPGVLSEPADARNLPALLSSYLRERGEPDACFTVHRLDREVGGLMLLARTHEAAAALISQITAQQVTKEYCAVLRGRPEQPRAVLEDLLFRDAARGKSYVVARERKGVRRAKLAYRLLAEAADADGTPLSLVRVRLFTGRTHQIRVQFASRGIPLLGDGRYGGRDPRCTPALFSCLLGFTHPVTGRPMCFFHRPPEDFPWSLFPKSAYAYPYPLLSESGGNP